MHVERDYDIALGWFRILFWVAIAVLLLAVLVPSAEAQPAGSICGAARLQVTGSTALDSTDSFMVVDGACPAAGSLYKRATFASVLLLTGRVTEHATDCTGTTAIAPAICYERDANTVYICDLAAGSSCTAANWTVTAGGGGADGVGYDEVMEEGAGLTKRAQVNIIGPDVTCADNGGATRTDCTIPDLAAAAHTHDASTLVTDSVSADELNATGVESELEAVLEVGQLQGGLAADQVDTLTDIAAALKSGSDATLVTGTEGATDDCAKWDANGDLVSAGGACGVASGDITDVFGCASGDCSSIAAGATDLLDFSGNDASTTTEGLIFPQHATACAGGTAEGQVCWEADANKLWVGNGATLTEVGAGGADTGPSPDCSGTSTYQDGEGGCDAVGGDLSGGLNAAAVADDSHAHTSTTVSGLDISADTNLAATAPVVLTGDTLSLSQNAGTDVTADLEEETHATEHSLGGADPVTVTNLASGCTDGQVLGGTAGGTGVECQADAGGGGGGGDREFFWSAAALLPLEHAADSVAPVALDNGTNADAMVRLFDAAADECAGSVIQIPAEVDTAGTVSLTAVWYSATATTGDAMWDIRYSAGAQEGVSWDTALTTKAAAADTTQGTVDFVTFTTWTETVTTLAWAAGDYVNFELCRDANHASDTLAGDLSLVSFKIVVPLA